MSDEALRDRIAAAIAGEEEYSHPGGYAAHAQAIIDDLGLTVEETNAETKRIDENGTTWYDVDHHKMMTRVVGKWEKQ